MRRWFGAAVVVGFGCANLIAGTGPAAANGVIVIAIDKAAQRMAVTVDGKREYLWKVSTGSGGAPKAGTYQPQRLEKSWFSRKYDMSPMPHSIFFHEGMAIHGTQYISRLGTIASHGCVRLHPVNAATLFNLVRTKGMAATTIVVTRAGWPDVANAPVTTTAPVPAALKPKPDRVLLERHLDTAPGTTGAVLIQPGEPPALAAAGSEPIKIPAQQQ
jgi:hypothetical protein